MMKETKDYWEKGPPMGFIGEDKGYLERRQFRYGLQDYMHHVFQFSHWENRKVLDIGCGGGIDTAEFAGYGAQVTAIDFTDVAVETTKELLRLSGFGAQVLKMDATDLKLNDNSFDLVYSFGVLHHIPDVEKALAEIHRVLKPGGRAMAMVYNRDSLLYGFSLMYLRGMVENWLEILKPHEIESRFSERYEGNPYTHCYTKTEAIDLFSKYFGGVSASIHYNVIDLPDQRKVKVGIDDKYGLGWHIVVKGVNK